MNSRELMRAAMRREPTDRIPTMPQICHDTPVMIYAAADGTDPREGYRRCAEHPTAMYEYVIKLVRQVGCDGLRLFVPSDPLKIVIDGDVLEAIDPKTDERIGRLDMYGGGQIVLDNPPAPVETLEEAGGRLNEMLEDLTDEKIDTLRDYRASVLDLFVASGPGGMTMCTYNKLRGREQGMFDFFERPDFVSGVMDMLADIVIQRAEKLLRTGIDAFYIGDPSASGSLIGPWHFEQFCLPGYQKFCRHFKDAGILIYIHVCGNSRPILEMLADTGADVIEPLDPLSGVEVADAKARVGDRVALMGGVNTLTLCRGTADDVRAEAIAKCREGGPTGYILAAGDMVPPDTPLENLQAMVDVARKSLWR